MINVNELRTGNWVSIDEQPAQLDEDAMEVLFAARNWGSLTPIPLTPEILIACGGKNMGGWTGLFSKVEIWDEEISFVFQLMDGVLTVIANDSYVKKIDAPGLHDLQNAFNVFIGKELTYTPGTEKA